MTELQEFKEAQIKALQSKVEKLEAEVKLENEKKRRIVMKLYGLIERTDSQMDIDELVDVIKRLDPTNPILQHLTL